MKGGKAALCACGCAKTVSPGKTWLKGHCNRGVSRNFCWVTNGKDDRQIPVTAELPIGWWKGTSTGGSKNKGKSRPDATERMKTGGAAKASRARWGDPRPKYWRNYRVHKDNAAHRGIPFYLTFEEWLGVWEKAGKLPGNGTGVYVMGRFGDKGAYEVGNVRIITAAENYLEAYARPEVASAFKERLPRMLAKRKERHGY